VFFFVAQLLTDFIAEKTFGWEVMADVVRAEFLLLTNDEVDYVDVDVDEVVQEFNVFFVNFWEQVVPCITVLQQQHKAILVGSFELDFPIFLRYSVLRLVSVESRVHLDDQVEVLVFDGVLFFLGIFT